MRRFFLTCLLALACFLPTMLASNPADAASMTWRMRSFDKSAVDVNFHSKNRKVVWPANGQVFPLANFEERRFKISCVVGEQICYGAWQRGNPRKAWGVGKEGKLGCQNCCVTCTDNAVTGVYRLNE